MNKRLEDALTVVLTTAAVVMAGAVTAREIRSHSPERSVRSSVDRAPVFYPDWRSWLANARFIAADTAPAYIIVFSDFECPGCKLFHESSLAEIGREFGSLVAIGYVHFPLPIHRFSKAAARAAECAADQGRFAAFVDAVFADQDSIGLRPWTSYALSAGVADSAEYQQCLGGTPTPVRIAAGDSLARQYAVTGTPTVFINGWRVSRPLTPVELRTAVERVLSGKKPFR